jgi:hypothetical protein
MLSSPWFAKKRTKDMAGKRRNSLGPADQTAAPMATM